MTIFMFPYVNNNHSISNETVTMHYFPMPTNSAWQSRYSSSCSGVTMRVVIELTHWGRVTPICVSGRIIIRSDNGLSPGRRLCIIWTTQWLYHHSRWIISSVMYSFYRFGTDMGMTVYFFINTFLVIYFNSVLSWYDLWITIEMMQIYWRNSANVRYFHEQ